jgi:SRSO17 transposase
VAVTRTRELDHAQRVSELARTVEIVANGLFRRCETQQSFAALVGGLLCDTPRKNSWRLAEQLGHAASHRLAWLLDGAAWDAEQLQARVRDHTATALGSPEAVLVATEAATLKKGAKSVGVARQFHPGLARTANCQVTALLAYAAPQATAFIDRRLYLPRSWSDDRSRREQAGIPPDVEYASKAELFRAMLAESFAARLEFSRFVLTAPYGHDPRLRRLCHRRAVPYLMRVPNDWARREIPATGAVDLLPATAALDPDPPGEDRWTAHPAEPSDEPAADGMTHWLLVRRSASGAAAEHFLAHTPQGEPPARLHALATGFEAGQASLEEAESSLGLDQYQVRKWTPWHRYTATCLLAGAFRATTGWHGTIPAECLRAWLASH